MAVVTNDIAEVGFDLRHLRHVCSGTWKSAGSEVLGGCICCTRREDFLEKISSIVKTGSIDYIIVESAGIAEPLHVAENFALVQNVVRLDCMVTILDAVAASSVIDALKTLSRMSDTVRKNMFMRKTLARPRKLFKPETQLLVEQLRFANVIVLNKCDAVEASVVDDLCNVIGLLNPAAHIASCTHGKTDLSKILHTNMFSMSDAENHKLWFADAQSQKEFRYCLLEVQMKAPSSMIESKAPVVTKVQSQNKRGGRGTYGSLVCGKVGAAGGSPWNFNQGWQCYDPSCEEC
jgi:G3E family GTPase